MIDTNLNRQSFIVKQSISKKKKNLSFDFFRSFHHSAAACVWMCKVTFVTNEQKKNSTKNSSAMHHFFAIFIVSFLRHFNHHNQRFFKFLKRSLFVNILVKLIIERRFLTKKEIFLFSMNNYSTFHSLFHHTIIDDILG